MIKWDVMKWKGLPKIGRDAKINDFAGIRKATSIEKNPKISASGWASSKKAQPLKITVFRT